MIKKVIYGCSYCEQVFEDKDSCAAHEKIHRTLKLRPGDLAYVSSGGKLRTYSWLIVREVRGVGDCRYSGVCFGMDRLSDQPDIHCMYSQEYPTHIIPREDILQLEGKVADLKRKYREKLKVPGLIRITVNYAIHHTNDGSVSLECTVKPEFDGTLVSILTEYKPIGFKVRSRRKKSKEELQKALADLEK